MTSQPSLQVLPTGKLSFSAWETSQLYSWYSILHPNSKIGNLVPGTTNIQCTRLTVQQLDTRVAGLGYQALTEVVVRWSDVYIRSCPQLTLAHFRNAGMSLTGTLRVYAFNRRFLSSVNSTTSRCSLIGVSENTQNPFQKSYFSEWSREPFKSSSISKLSYMPRTDVSTMS